MTQPPDDAGRTGKPSARAGAARRPRGSAPTAARRSARPAPSATVPAPSPQVVTVSADAIAAAVLGCPLVVGLSGGRAGEIASYLPGRRVTGVRIGDGAVTVHVVAAYGPTCEQIATQVRQAVHAVVGGLPVMVGIDDLDLDRRIITL